MTPRKTLEELCALHGLPYALGKRLLPLVDRALNSPDDMRDRILNLVKGTLKREARRFEESKRNRELDDRILGVIAKVVHPWNPPKWLQVWSKKNRDLEEDERGIA